MRVGQQAKATYFIILSLMKSQTISVTGLTQAEFSPVNQSIEAFVYCILGAQVNV